MRVLAGLLVIAAMACGDHAPPARPSNAPPPTAATAAPSSKLDQLFAQYVKQLPEPQTISEQNGASLECANHETTTYVFLDGTAERLPIDSDADLVHLVKWAHHADPCIRQIAMEAIVHRIGFDSDRLSVPPMHDPDHHEFHEIFVALRAYLVAKHVAIPPHLFDGMWLAVTPGDLPRLVGTWHEVVTPSHNFETAVELGRELVKVTLHHREPDPAWPDHMVTIKVANVTVTALGQLVIAAEWDQASNGKGYVGKKNSPSEVTYAIWPVRDGVVWFSDGLDGHWEQLRRK